MSNSLSPLHTGLFPLPVFGMEVLFSIWKPVGIEMTLPMAVFLASLLDLKDRTCSIFQLGPGMLLIASAASRQQIIKTSLRRCFANFISSMSQRARVIKSNPCAQFLSLNYFKTTPLAVIKPISWTILIIQYASQ